MALFYLNNTDFTYFYRKTSLLYIFMPFSFGSVHFYRQSRCLYLYTSVSAIDRIRFLCTLFKITAMCHYFKLTTAAE